MDSRGFRQQVRRRVDELAKQHPEACPNAEKRFILNDSPGPDPKCELCGDCHGIRICMSWSNAGQTGRCSNRSNSS